MSDGVVVTPEEMYRVLMRIDSSLSQLISTVDTIDDRVADHEARLRSIEQREDLSRRVAKMETTLQNVQQRVWAFPSLAGVAAVIAIVVAVSDRF
jgi:hypothetical protein